MALESDSNSGARLLTLIALAGETLDHYDLIRFEGREAISEPFEYRLELRAREAPASLGDWIGKAAEFAVGWRDDEPRTFAGRIYEAHIRADGGGLPIVLVTIRPAYWATNYARGTHFMQDRTSIEIFDAVTADVPGLTVEKSASAAKRPYAVRYDETELQFLDRLLAQDGIYYYFAYSASGGAFHHKMVIAASPSGYADVAGSPTLSFDAGGGAQVGSLSNSYRAVAGTRRYHSFEVSKLDTPLRDTSTVSKSYGAVYKHSHEELSGAALTADQSSARGTAHTQSVEQEMEVLAGTSSRPELFAGGKVAIAWSEGGAPRKVVLTSIEHVAEEYGSQQGGGTGSYTNSFTAIDATLTFRPPVPSGRRRAYGPVLGVVKNDNGAEGEIVVDAQSRVPVAVSQVLENDATKPFAQFVWLPVTQQWASGTHGAQFLPRIGTRVMVDFLYGDPDLPFVAGTFYTPSAAYPFDPASKATQTGWRSKTNKNGAIAQEFMFEDKPDAEEIYMYTGRNYRRMIDKDELGTIKNDRTIEVQHDHKETVKNDQTILVENDQKETVKHDRAMLVENDHTEEVKNDQTVKIDNDQKETIGNDQTITIKNNRKLGVTGTQDTKIDKTRTVTVMQKSLLESKQEIELKVGQSSIKLTLQGIEISAPTIKIKAEATLDVSAGVQAQYKAPIVQVNADGMLVLKGGIVMIN